MSIGGNGICACTHIEEGWCCFRKDGFCRALSNCNFDDGYCHFRKDYPDGPNLYDQMRREQEQAKKKKVG